MKSKYVLGIGVFLILIAVSVPRLIGLGRFVTADEPTFAKDAANFYYAFTHGDFGATYQSGYPGVTTMALGALAYWLEFPDYKDVGEPATGDKHLLIAFYRHGPAPVDVLATARFLQSLTILVTLAMSFVFARRIFLTLPAVLGFLLILFDAFHIAHSRILHTNALLASFMFLSVVAFLDYLQSRRWVSLIVSSLGAALSILTVTTGLILVPAIGVIALADYLAKRIFPGEGTLKILFRRYLLPGLIWSVVVLLLIVMLFPSVWVNSIATFEKMLDFTLLSARGASSFSDEAGSQSSTMGQSSNGLLFYARSYLWRSSPVVWGGLIFAAIFLLSRKSRTARPWQRWGVLMLLLYVLVYTLVMSLGTKKFDRYLLPIFLPFDLVAGVGWVTFATWLVERYAPLRRVHFTYLLTGLLVVVQACLVVPHHPYYLTYTNPLLGKADEIPDDMFTGWGEGLSEAALYLREQPGIDQLEVVTWYPLAFNWYSQGIGFNAQPVYANPEVDEQHLAEYLGADYVITYINQWQRGMARQLLEALEGIEPEHVVSIKGVEYVRIYRLR